MNNYFVVGNSVSTSLSPTIFNYWFKKYKIKASYGYIEIKNKNFTKEITEAINNKETKGLNITIPFKKQIIKHIDILDKHSKKINAVNCILIGKKIKGINTDWLGYFNSLPKNINIKNKTILLVGYGGAAQAIHYVLRKKGFKKIIIFNRTRRKINFFKKLKYTKNLNTLDKYLESAGLIINTTPKNVIKKSKKHLVDKDVLLSDIVYSPKETEFLKMFPKNKKIYGISMLLHQAIPCFKLWFGFNPSVDTKLIKILNKKIK